MKTKKWLIVRKKEMTKLWVNDRQTAVTLLEIVPQEVIRYKTSEKDGYEATVIGVERKDLNKEKWQKISYTMVQEFGCDDASKSAFPAGAIVAENLLEGVEKVDLTGVSKGKGFAWVMKRFHTKWWPKTHGSKFHRHVWSLGNRKPRRVQKGHPHAGHMGTETVTLHSRPVVEITTLQWSPYVIVKWSVPGSYNGYISLYVS
jgi:large subunit ribosomal protein L3